jgi:hypothetical protein
MSAPNPLRCSSRDHDDRRCRLVRYHPGGHTAKISEHGTSWWGREANLRETFETDAPWITYRWLSDDRETRFTGRMRMRAICCICGGQRMLRPRIPRFGPVPVPEGGRHPVRLAFIEEHAHPDRGAPMSWALPLRNPAAFSGGIPLDALAMRLEADINEVAGSVCEHEKEPG